MAAILENSHHLGLYFRLVNLTKLTIETSRANFGARITIYHQKYTSRAALNTHVTHSCMHAGGDGEHVGPGAVAPRHRGGAGATPRSEGSSGGTSDVAQTQPHCGNAPSRILRHVCVHVFVLFVQSFFKFLHIHQIISFLWGNHFCVCEKVCFLSL